MGYGLGHDVFSPQQKIAFVDAFETNVSALVSMAVVLIVVILPMIAIATALLQEATTLYGVLNSGEIDFGQSFKTIADNLPQWTRRLLYVLGVQNLDAVQQKTHVSVERGHPVSELFKFSASANPHCISPSASL